MLVVEFFKNELNRLFAQGAVACGFPLSNMEVFAVNVRLSATAGHISVEWVGFVRGGRGCGCICIFLL
jgi:hypothetical protein